MLRNDDPDPDALLATNPGAGWLYAVVAPDVNRVKVGHARDVWGRMLLFQTGSPLELYLHAATLHSEVRKAESEAHRELADARIQGECFDLTDARVDAWLARRERDEPANGLWDRYAAARRT